MQTELLMVIQMEIGSEESKFTSNSMKYRIASDRMIEFKTVNL